MTDRSNLGAELRPAPCQACDWGATGSAISTTAQETMLRHWQSQWHTHHRSEVDVAPGRAFCAVADGYGNLRLRRRRQIGKTEATEVAPEMGGATAGTAAPGRTRPQVGRRPDLVRSRVGIYDVAWCATSMCCAIKTTARLCGHPALWAEWPGRLPLDFAGGETQGCQISVTPGQ